MTSSPPGPYAGIPLWRRPIARRPGEVQFGVGEGGPIVTGVTADEARLLARLDGSLPPDALGAVAGAVGVSGRRWRVLLDLVARLGLLEPLPNVPALALTTAEAPAPIALTGRGIAGGAARPTRAAPPGTARRPGFGVLVEGPGSLSAGLARLLGAEPGLVVRHGCSGDDDPSGSAGLTSLRALGTSPLPLPRLVVLVADIALDPRRGDIWLAREVAHLPVVTTAGPSGGSAVVGPLVGPLVSAGSGAPCLWCLDLHRSDRDDAWPTVMAQVAGLPGDPQPGAAAGLPHLVAGLVAALVARCLDGDPPPPGVAVEVSLPWPRLDHRRWQAHPRCRQHALAGTPGTPNGRRT
ncbi:MAG: cell division protein FtsQ/DivIB [Humibacillus sp.]